MHSPGLNGLRQRRAHRKSRLGCRNCKLRRVKCDETRPRCAKCRSYGVLCDYAGPSPDLQLPQELKIPAPVVADTCASIELDARSLASLVRFERRTIGTAVNVPPKSLVQLAMRSPYLMHAILAFTDVHDRYLGCQTLTAPGTRQFYHASRSSSLFSRRLSHPIQADDRDTIWATATLLGILAVTSVPMTSREVCWPSTEADLDWLQMSRRKMALWKFTDPLRPDSLFGDMLEEYLFMYSQRSNAPDGIGAFCDPNQLSLPANGVLSDLYHLCGLHSSSSAPWMPDTNPYHGAFIFLRVLYPENAEAPLARFHALVFISRMQPCFINLLCARDPVALLLLALWYERAGRLIWWVRCRALVEGPVICAYLTRKAGDDAVMGRILSKGWDWQLE